MASRRTSTRIRRTSGRQGPRAPAALVDRMLIATIGLVQAFEDRLMRALAPYLAERFGQRQDASLDEIFAALSGEQALSRTFLQRMFRLVDRQAQTDLAQVVPVSLGDVLPNAAQLEQQFVRANTDLIRLEERARREVETIVRETQATVRVEAVRDQIQERLGVVRSRAELIARDQTLKLYGQVQEERQTAAGIEEYTWSTSDDERVREDHADLDGTTQRWDSPPIVDRRTGRREHPGGDYQCIPGGSEILLANPVYCAFRRRHCGQLTQLVTDSGETLECTPNHPVLTASGWLPAQSVQVGDQIFQAREDCRELLKTHVQYRVASVQHVFETLALLFKSSRHGAVATEFHGDALADEHVEIVDVDRELRIDFESSLSEYVGELQLADPDPTGLRLGDADTVLHAIGATSHSSVGSLRLRLAQFFWRVRESSQVGITASAGCLAGADDERSDACAGDPEAFAQRFDRGTLPVSLQARCLINWLRVVRAQVDTSGAAAKDAESLTVEAQAACDFRPAERLLAQPTRVIENRFRDFSGHVYNLSTQGEWYIARNLIMHNCRCAAIPVLPTGESEAPAPAPRLVPQLPEPEVRERDLQRLAQERKAEAEARARVEAIPQALQGASARVIGEVPASYQAAANRGLSVFKPAGLQTYRITSQVGSGPDALGKGVAGAYRARDRSLTIGTSAAHVGELAKGTKPSTVQGLTPKLAKQPMSRRYSKMLGNVSDVSTTTERAIEITTTHEFAHHLHLPRTGSEAEMLIRRAYHGPDATGREDLTASSTWTGRQPVSAYGDANLAEFWAEAVAGYYHLPREWMRTHAPETLSMVERVLGMMGQI